MEKSGADIAINTKRALAPKQEQALAKSVARLNIADGPVRSGKTVGLEVWRWFEYCCTAPEGDLLMSAKTMKSLERNVLRPMQDTFGRRWVQYSLGKKEAHIAGRRVELEGANDERSEDKIRGMTLAGALTNEITLMPESFFRQIMARMSVPGAKLFGTTNPDSPYHWLKTDFLDREDELDLRRFRFKLSDNLFLDPHYVKALKSEYTGLWYKRFILGQWVLAAGAVYDMWDEDKHIGLPDAYVGEEPFLHLVGIDYGTSNPCVFLDIEIYGDQRSPHAHVARERYYDGRVRRQKTDSQHADDLARFRERITGRHIDYVDPSAASFRAAVRGLKEADNSVLDGIRFVASMLGSGRLTVNPQCKNTRREFGAYVWDERAQQKGEDKPAKEYDHCMDALRYPLYTHLGAHQGVFAGSTVNL
ncbi:MAG: PBSX family phage terminase large subunit [Bacteroidetes bacterium]|nr:PBSX family phage terminase large subunit [Bacteroidota bacterium]